MIMNLITPSCVLRKWSDTDIPSLILHANHPEVAKWMRNGFPSPYTQKDAEHFIEMTTGDNCNLILAIDIRGEAVGGIGVHQLNDIYQKTAEIGYWLSPAFQGRGIVTDAVHAIIPVAFHELPIIRIQAGVFHTNLPSIRVLEKNGFVLEAIHKDAIFKNGQIFHECLYVTFHTQ